MRLIALFIAIALAAGAFFTMMHFTSKESPEGVPVVKPQITFKEVPSVNVYTARQDIPIGVLITPEMLDIQPWPQHLLLPEMVPADPSKATEIVQMVTRTPFSKGEPIIMNKLANIKDPSFLAAALPKGMRVITVPVDAVSGVGGFVFPGDHVDVLVTHDVAFAKAEKVIAVSGGEPSGTENPGGNTGDQGGAAGSGMKYVSAPEDAKAAAAARKDQVTEVLLSNVLVMAVNQKSAVKGGEPPTLPNNVSLQVFAADAQKIRLAESGNGRLSLTLRALKDQNEMTLPRPTGIGDLSRLTPPSYFPVLYDSSGRAMGVAEINEDENESNSVMVVRGVRAEAVEVSQP